MDAGSVRNSHHPSSEGTSPVTTRSTHNLLRWIQAECSGRAKHFGGGGRLAALSWETALDLTAAVNDLAAEGTPAAREDLATVSPYMGVS